MDQRKPYRPNNNQDFSLLAALIKKFILQGGVFFVMAIIIGLLFFLYNGIILVKEGEMAILLKKTGENLTSAINKEESLSYIPIIAPNSKYKGIQLEPLGEGWHFYNPFTWDYEIHPQIQIPKGFLGVQIRYYGKSLDLTKKQYIANEGEKGIINEVLRPGTYLINPYAYKIEAHRPVAVRSGHRGVVTNLAGKIPKNPNAFLVKKGERGVCQETLSSGTYYVNPYIQKISSVDIRSHRFDLRGEYNVEFPSFDGFPIVLEGTIEWAIEADKVASVYVKYKDTRDILTCIVEKVILPNARAFIRIEGSKYLAKKFISGKTRGEFQDQFFSGLSNTCIKEGIIIKSARVTKCIPPDKICDPIQKREIAIRTRQKYTEQIKREIEEKTLKMEESRKDLEIRKTKAETQVQIAVTAAKREKDVAIIEMQQQLEVARKKKEAALNQAEAIVLEATAKADVIRMRNKAQASGLKEATDAFNSGENYVKFLLLQKIGGSLEYILSNTDSPFVKIFDYVTKKSKINKKETIEESNKNDKK